MLDLQGCDLCFPLKKKDWLLDPGSQALGLCNNQGSPKVGQSGPAQRTLGRNVLLKNCTILLGKPVFLLKVMSLWKKGEDSYDNIHT